MRQRITRWNYVGLALALGLVILIVATVCVGGWALMSAMTGALDRIPSPLNVYIVLAVGYVVIIVDVAQRVMAWRRRAASRRAQTDVGPDSPPPDGETPGEGF